MIGALIALQVVASESADCDGAEVQTDNLEGYQPQINIYTPGQESFKIKMDSSIASFPLVDIDGKESTLSPYLEGKKAALVVNVASK